MIVFPRAEIVGFEGDCPFRDGATRADGKTVRFWPSMSPVQAFGAEHQTDAHCVSYDLVNAAGAVLPQAPRINKEALPALAALGIRPVFSALLIDLDDKVGKDSSPDRSARPEWRAAFSESVARLPAWLQPHLVRYDTRGGARLLVVTEPLELDAYERARDGLYALCVNAGMEVDRLTDWNRLMRLPNVMREGKRQAYKVDVGPMSTPLPVELAATLAMHVPPPPPLPPAPPRPPRPVQYNGESERPGDTFNRVKSWDDVLLPMGWMRSHDHQGRPAYRRPGSKKTPSEHSAYVTPDGNLFVRTTSMEPHGLDGNKSYTPFGLMAATWGMAPDEAAKRVRDQLVDEGHLEPYVDRLADPDLIDLVRGGELARQDWEAVRAAQPKGEKAKGKTERPRQFDGANEVRFESDSDVTLAIALCQELEAGLEAPVVGCEGTLWRYESPRWRPLKAFQIENHVAAWEGSPIPSFRGDPMPMRLGNAKIKSVVERAKVERADPEFFRDHVGAIAFRNGMATLRRGGVVVEPPSPDHRVRHVIDLEYTDKDPVHLFDLLGSCFEGCDDAAERALFLSEFVGACLAGVATRFETATILLGHGANGKSTFLNHAVRPIFPASSITAVSPQDMGKEYNRASLVGSAINIVSEMPDGDILGAEAVKAIISGETVQARHIREAPFDLNCRAGHLYAANDLPALRDFSAGFQRRWRIIGFPNVFPKDSPKRRTDWPELLTSELGAIASWYARCVARVLPDLRYTNVASSEAEVYRWVNEADSVSVWVDARCERSTATTLGAKLYVDYRNWVTSVGMRPVTIQKFGRRLSRLGVSSIHSRGGEARGLLLRFGGDAS
jgi:P4 family phage/plasmid primase-like protien